MEARGCSCPKYKYSIVSDHETLVSGALDKGSQVWLFQRTKWSRDLMDKTAGSDYKEQATPGGRPGILA